MKISPFDPKAACASGSLDDSRLGFHTRSVTRDNLSSIEHGAVLLGFADDTGVRNVGGRPGAKEAPRAVRNKLYKFTIGAPALPFYDLGDLEPAPSIEETHRQATALVREIAAAGHFPVVLGGGHDFGFPHELGALEASGGARFRFCNIDAHLDVRPASPVVTSGSPWFLLREHALFQQSRSSIEEFGVQPHCNARVLVEYARKHGFGLHWLSEIRARRRPADESFRRLLGPATGKERLLVSLDIDSVQIAEAPGCSAPQTLGFQAEEVLRMCHATGAHPRAQSLGIFELSPPLDHDGRTAQLVAHCVSSCLAGLAERGAYRVKRKRKSALGKGRRKG